MPLHTIDKKKIIEKFALSEKDTGSSAVQIAVLTEEIRYLTEHMKIHRKDFASKRGLITKVSKRRSLLKYLKRVDEVQYKDIIGRLGLKR
ncbi:30S ribosomal protein S15 [bacterium]|nr:30S ribosomal protein S15 [bacterium]